MLTLTLPYWLDSFLIAPFRWPSLALAGLWLGSTLLALYAVFIGEITTAALYKATRKHHTKLQQEMQSAHDSSVAALQAGDKASYLAINRLAHEKYGRYFFAQAGLGTASLWPVPFALAWMATRFEGIAFFPIPYTDRSLGYVFVFLTSYITLRVALSWLKRCLKRYRSTQ